MKHESFSFISMALPGDTFRLIDFESTGGLSQFFEATVNLVSTSKHLDFDEILENPATIKLTREHDTIYANGVLREFVQLHAVGPYVFYRAVMVPKLWRLSLTHHNQVFLNQTVPQILAQTLQDGGLLKTDFEFRLARNYAALEYVCQCNETHYNFFCRWLESQGMYYYFQDGQTNTKLIVTDTSIAHAEAQQGAEAIYSPPTGLDQAVKQNVVSSFSCQQRVVPATVMLKSYNYHMPSLDIAAQAQAVDSGIGQVYKYGERVETPSEAKELSKIRAEELRCRRRRYSGESTVPFIRAGHIFHLKNHYNEQFNRAYMTTHVKHFGSQASFLLSGLGLPVPQETPFYHNSFEAIEADVQFRPERVTPKPRVYGMLNAHIDAAGTGQYAELDEQGRYRVLLPFDLSGRHDGKASHWLRMAQPYTGAGFGMHFPLHKGAEVLLSFIHGDPDQPIIIAAVPNPETPSVLNNTNQTSCQIRSAGGNLLSMQDHEGNQRIVLASGDGGSKLICGSLDSGSPTVAATGCGSAISMFSNLNNQLSTYFMSASDLGSTLMSSFSYSAYSGAVIPSLLIHLSQSWAANMEQREGKGEHSAYGSALPTALSLASTSINALVQNWIRISMFKMLAKLGVQDSGFKKRAKDIVTTIGKCKSLWNYTTGISSSYGVQLFSNMPHLGKWEPGKYTTGFIDPRMASFMFLSKGGPDVLVAATYGVVDVVGVKGVNLFSDNGVINVEGANVDIRGDSHVRLYSEQGPLKGAVTITMPGPPHEGVDGDAQEPEQPPTEGNVLINFATSKITLAETAISVKALEKVTLAAGANALDNSITLDYQINDVTVRAAREICLVSSNVSVGDAGKRGLIKVNGKDITASASQDLTLSANKGLALKAQQGASVTGQNVQISSKTTVTIKGQKMKIL